MKKILFYTINFLICLTIWLKAENPTFISFQVTDEAGKPLHGCKISVRNTSKIFFTDKFGKASVKLNSSQSHQISFEKAFYNPFDTTIFVNKDIDTFFILVRLKEKDIHSREVVITATRTEKDLVALPIPMTTLSQFDFKQINAKTLDQALMELTDINIVDDHGRGIQLQGLDPDYTLILINGEPLVKRTGGILDISRLSVGNASRIEIVRGPNSSIYGSNALAGVVNIITSEPENETEISLFSKYGSYNSLDLIGELKKSLISDILAFTLFAHRSKTDGFSLIPNSVGKTVPEITNYNLQGEVFYNPTRKSRLRIAFRGNFENEINSYLANKDTISSNNDVGEISSFLNFKNILNDRFNYEFRAYFSTFTTNTQDRFVKTKELYDAYKFSQDVLKLELQTNYAFSLNNYMTLGGGFITEQAKSLRIAGGKESNRQFFIYLQDDIKLIERLNVIGSLRFDNHSDYASQVSPKISLSYQLNKNIVLRSSVGTGFQAPDFEELYLDWTNPMAGYSVFGRTYAAEGLKKLQQQGQIATILISPDTIGKLEPEKSLSFDFGGNFSIDELFLKINFFRNNIQNLIDFLPIAIKTNGQRLHTYQNINKIYTQGVEFSLEYSFLKNFQLNISYQFLQTGDLDVIEKIKNRKIFKRDANGNDVPVNISDYGGLFHRPEHSGNIRLTYRSQDLGLFSSFRVNVKSKYGYKDINGNMILDDPREFAPGYAIFRWNISKELFKYFVLNFGVDNLFDRKDARFLAANPGRTFYFSIDFKYIKN